MDAWYHQLQIVNNELAVECVVCGRCKHGWLGRGVWSSEVGRKKPSLFYFVLFCAVLLVRSKWTAGIFNFRKSTMILRSGASCAGDVNMGGVWVGVRPSGAGRKRMWFFGLFLM